MVGSKIKAIRKRKGYTLAVLAEKTGYTASFLSQVERGIKQPSMAALQTIAAKLEVSVGDFFPARDEKNAVNCQPIWGSFHIISATNRLEVTFPDLKARYSIITPQRGEHDEFKLLGVYICLQPGQSVSTKEEIHRTEESVFVLKGVLDATFQGRAFFAQRRRFLLYRS